MTGDTSTIARLLRTARLEVLPTDSITAEVRAHAPQHRTVTITASESLGLDATLAVACALRADGRRVVPHLAARMVSGRSHLEDIVDRLHAAGVDAVFVPGGDATPGPGAYTSSLALLRDLEQMDHPFRDIGVAAYPESHPTIPDAEVVRALADKHPFATEMVSNLCFDPDALSAWIRSARDRGTALPLWLGVALCGDTFTVQAHRFGFRLRLRDALDLVGLGQGLGGHTVTLSSIDRVHGIANLGIRGDVRDQGAYDLEPVAAHRLREPAFDVFSDIVLRRRRVQSQAQSAERTVSKT